MKTLTQNFRLSVAESNGEQEMALPLLVSRIIDIATDHANMLHIGNPDMEQIRGGWVLSRLSIEALRYPRTQEFYSITTWVEDFNRHFSTRCFRVDDADGNPIVHARSIWMVIDIETHTNLGLGHFNISEDIISPEIICPIPRQAKHRKIANTREAGVLEMHSEHFYRFKYCDLDYYRHVNTVRYVQLLLNQFPLETFDNSLVSRFELSFLKEAHYGMTVAVRLNKGEGGENSLTLTDAETPDGNPLLFARMNFSSR